MITIVDYGMGNLYSVANALEHLGQPWEISGDPEKVAHADRVILPGVGSFQEASRRLTASGLGNALRMFSQTGRDLLGICLGMQLLATGGDEGGESPGLGLIPGRTIRLQTHEKLPHVGWNQLHAKKPDPLLTGLADSSQFYFVHSYVLDPSDPQALVAGAVYGPEFCAMVRYGNLAGVQFHPEKSSAAGLRLLQNFAEGREEQ